MELRRYRFDFTLRCFAIFFVDSLGALFDPSCGIGKGGFRPFILLVSVSMPIGCAAQVSVTVPMLMRRARRLRGTQYAQIG
jgi:hypothetical protein